MANKIKLIKAVDNGKSYIIQASVVDGDGKEVLPAQTFQWGKDVPKDMIARETKLLLKEQLAKAEIPITVPGLNGQAV